ncbi:hypothetical protein LX86_002231 [Lentzea aerocolonigenes]|nr:hypothetical protein [Lentzea aerocolonigenes]
MPTDLLAVLGVPGAVHVAVGLAALMLTMRRQDVVPGRTFRRSYLRRREGSSAPLSESVSIRSGRREEGVPTRLRGVVGTPAYIGLCRRS